jgi:hypothetical protein
MEAAVVAIQFSHLYRNFCQGADKEKDNQLIMNTSTRNFFLFYVT